ncbi:hypothetical protein DC31_16460 [Microbacterium sp. CH12i]|nr:hypothetical protein [Microbacterium sp. CH12i]KDA05484.1 hypothetical protein DC31_16460 [Microbacterium sp. CH12i]
MSFAEDVCIDGEDGAGFVAEVFGDFIHGSAESQPGGRRVVTESVATEAEGELADDADGELPTLLVGEQVVVRVLPGGILAEDRQGARRERYRAGAAPRLRALLLVVVGV